jgi:hypothetical protein
MSPARLVDSSTLTDPLAHLELLLAFPARLVDSSTLTDPLAHPELLLAFPAHQAKYLAHLDTQLVALHQPLSRAPPLLSLRRVCPPSQLPRLLRLRAFPTPAELASLSQ